MSEELCIHCGSHHTVRNGSTHGYKRHLCRACGRSFSSNPIPKRFDKSVKDKALQMYLNNVGIRKIALFLGASPPGVLKWIRAAHARMAQQISQAAGQVAQGEADIIEMDEIYTYVQKNSNEQSSGLLILDGKVALLRLK